MYCLFLLLETVYDCLSIFKNQPVEEGYLGSPWTLAKYFPLFLEVADSHLFVLVRFIGERDEVGGIYKEEVL